MCRVKSFKKFARTLGKISLIGGYKVWLARRSNEWAPGQLVRAWYSIYAEDVNNSYLSRIYILHLNNVEAVHAIPQGSSKAVGISRKLGLVWI